MKHKFPFLVIQFGMSLTRGEDFTFLYSFHTLISGVNCPFQSVTCLQEAIVTKIVHVLAAVFIIANVLPRTTSSTHRIHVENARAVEDFTVITCTYFSETSLPASSQKVR